MKLTLAKINSQNLATYMFWQSANHDYQVFNGPYFVKDDKAALKRKEKQMSSEIEANGHILNRRFINIENKAMIGEVSYYWRSKETHWLEIGIAIYEKQHWSKGIGLQALNLWIDHIFNTFPELVRIGLTSWSGNYGMIKLAAKLGMDQEACYRKARIVNGEYYDSVSYGILKEQWILNKNEGSLHSPH